MTKKDYELIAKAIKGRRDNTWNLDKLGWTGNEICIGISVIDDLSEFLAHDLSKQNPRFNRSKFLKACGLEA